MSAKKIDMSNKNNGDASVSIDSSHSPGSGIYEILSMIDYLQPELAHIDSTAGHLLQMCKAELLQKLAMEAMTSALRNGPAQINADFASVPSLCERLDAEDHNGADVTRQPTFDHATH
jgi:hypothetical protein